MAPYTQNFPWQRPEKNVMVCINSMDCVFFFFLIFIHSIHLSIQNEYIHDTYNLMYMQDTVLPCVIALTSLLPPRTQEISPSPINRLSLSVFIPLQFLLLRRHRLSRFHPHDVSQPQSLDARGPRKKKKKEKQVAD